MRAQLVIDKVHEKLLDVRKARGLAFCVSVAHAEYMAEKFRAAGIPAEALTANSEGSKRQSVQSRLKTREINFICAVDLYNEGVDIPEVDTVLFIRPTESLTVFLQQLGRGLRLSEDKDCLTVLDLVGQAHRSFRFEPRFRSLLTDLTRSVKKEIEAGFPHLPAGCIVQLERVASERILANIRQNLSSGRQAIVRQIAEYAIDLGRAPTLSEFVEQFHVDIDDIYRRDSWSRLSAEAGCRPAPTDPDEERLARGLRRVAHCNDPQFINAALSMLRSESIDTALVEEIDAKRLLMLHFSLWGKELKLRNVFETLTRLDANPSFKQELIDLLCLRLEQVASVPPPLDLPVGLPVSLHADYTRDEILAALGRWTVSSQPDMREGVLHIPG